MIPEAVPAPVGAPVIRDARPSDLPAMGVLIFDHGANEWNYLPEREVWAHLDDIKAGNAWAVVAEQAGALIGLATFYISRHLSRYEPPSAPAHGYICEVVVHRDHAGRGLGTRLLQAVDERLFQEGVIAVYAERHEENAASAGMMRKAGFTQIDAFDDLARRPSGSRRTAVCRIERWPGRSSN